METSLSEIEKALEKEKCSFHKYRPMVFAREEGIEIIACCKSFEKFLEFRAKEMLKKGTYEIDRLTIP